MAQRQVKQPPRVTLSWIAWFIGLLLAAVAPWTSPKLPIAGCLGVDAAVLILGSGITAMVMYW